MKWPLGNSGATVSLQCTHSLPPRQPPRKPYRLYSTVTVSAAPETAPRYLRRPSRSLSTLVLVFLLFLDARIAFDSVVISFLIRTLYFSGMQGNSINYIHSRLNNRLTYCDWDKVLMGPIFDQQGLEQGGCSSSDLYKIYKNELL